MELMGLGRQAEPEAWEVLLKHGALLSQAPVAPKQRQAGLVRLVVVRPCFSRYGPNQGP
jgi:hypothetical protein